MLSECQDTLGQKRYLYFWRTCVLWMDVEFLDQGLLVILFQGYATPPFWSRRQTQLEIILHLGAECKTSILSPIKSPEKYTSLK